MYVLNCSEIDQVSGGNEFLKFLIGYVGGKILDYAIANFPDPEQARTGFYTEGGVWLPR